MEAVSVERERAVGAIVRAFAVERGELLRSFESQRLAKVEWATAERREAVADVSRELAGSITPFVASAPSSSTTCAASSMWSCCEWPYCPSQEWFSRRSSLTPTLASGPATALVADVIAPTSPRTSRASRSLK